MSSAESAKSSEELETPVTICFSVVRIETTKECIKFSVAG